MTDLFVINDHIVDIGMIEAVNGQGRAETLLVLLSVALLVLLSSLVLRKCQKYEKCDQISEFEEP